MAKSGWAKRASGSREIGSYRDARGASCCLLIAALLAACGEDSAPTTPAVPDTSSATGSAGAAGDPGDAPDAGGDSTPQPEPSPSTEGPPMIGGINPPPPPTNASCTPGETSECRLDQLCTGLATCKPDGSGFGACECDSKPVAGIGLVGAACESDAECSGGTCLRADGNGYLGAGGPAGGYCTFTCTDTSDCTLHDPESGCVPGIGGAGINYCIRTCLSRDAEPGEAKCLNRSNLVCISEVAGGTAPISADRQPGFCAPRCGDDSECPTGRVCHRQAGICTDGRAPGLPTGSRCDLDTQCDGRACENRIDGVGTCTAECVLGALQGCGYAHDDPQRKAACITPLVSAGRFSESSGDLGLCRELCDVDSDCLQAPAFICRQLSEPLIAYTGRKGACVLSAN